MADSDCVLGADYSACYYSKTAVQSHAENSHSSRSIVSGGQPDDRSRLVALIEEFNTNNHGLIMNITVCTAVHYLLTLTLCLECSDTVGLWEGQ